MANRSPFRFSLRTLLAGMLLAGAAMGWIGVRQQGYARQHAAARELAKYKAAVHWRGYDVVQVAFSGSAIDNDALAPLASLPKLERLALIDTAVTDAGMETIRQAPSLEELVILNSPISDTGLERLTALKRLELLRLDGALVTDEGLKHLPRFPALSRLHLANTRITDAGLVHLQAMSQLERLYVQGGDVSPEAARALRMAMPNTKIGY